MNKFLIKQREELDCFYEVEAENEEQAIEMVKEGQAGAEAYQDNPNPISEPEFIREITEE